MIVRSAILAIAAATAAGPLLGRVHADDAWLSSFNALWASSRDRAAEAIINRSLLKPVVSAQRW